MEPDNAMASSGGAGSSPAQAAPCDTAELRATSSAVPGTAGAHSMVLAKNWGVVLLRGLIAIVFGVVAIVRPGPPIASLVLLFSAYMLVDGVFAILSGVRAAQRHERWGWFILEGLADIAAAAIAFFRPAITVIVFVLLAAFWALVSGALMLGGAFRLDKRHGRGWLITAGIVSLVWGALLVFAPVAGAVVMTWWLGAYALAFGIAMLVLGWRLRQQQRSAVGSGNAGHTATIPGR